MVPLKEPVFAKLLDDNGKFLIHITKHSFHLCHQTLQAEEEGFYSKLRPYSTFDSTQNVIFQVKSTDDASDHSIIRIATVSYQSKSKRFELKVVHESKSITVNDKSISASSNVKKLSHGDVIDLGSHVFNFIMPVYVDGLNNNKSDESGPRLRSSSVKAENAKKNDESEIEDQDSELELYMSDLCYLDDVESNIMEGGMMRKYKSSESPFLLSNTHHKRSSNPSFFPSQNEYPILNPSLSLDSKNKQRKRAITDDEIKRDDQGRPILPLTFGGILLENLGEIIWDKDKFHSKRYIFPVGYCSKRSYFSLKDPSTRCWYKQEILENTNPTSTAKV